MTLVVETDEALDPVGAGFFGTDGIALETYGVTKMIQELFGTGFHRSPRRRVCGTVVFVFYYVRSRRKPTIQINSGNVGD